MEDLDISCTTSNRFEFLGLAGPIWRELVVIFRGMSSSQGLKAVSRNPSFVALQKEDMSQDERKWPGAISRNQNRFIIVACILTISQTVGPPNRYGALSNPGMVDRQWTAEAEMTNQIGARIGAVSRQG